MSNTLSSKSKNPKQSNSYFQLPPTRSAISINKIPPSSIANGNASLSKLGYRATGKVEPVGGRGTTGNVGRKEVEYGYSKDGKDMKDGKDGGGKTMYGSWMRSGSTVSNGFNE